MEKTSRVNPRDEFIHKILDVALFRLGLHEFTIIVTNDRIILKLDWPHIFIKEQLENLISLHNIELGINFEKKHFFFMIPEDFKKH